MANLFIAVCGFAGAGKTTAVKYLEKASAGTVFYLGGFIIEEVRRRGMDETRENERIVRMAMREADPAAIAKAAARDIETTLKAGTSVFLDAVMSPAEASFLATLSTEVPLRIVALESPADLRIERLSNRANRPFSEAEVTVRDQTEVRTLGLDAVIAGALFHIDNSGSLQHLYRKLDEIVLQLN